MPNPKISWLSLKLLNNNLDIDLEAVHRKNIELEWQASLNNNKIFERENIVRTKEDYKVQTTETDR